MKPTNMDELRDAIVRRNVVVAMARAVRVAESGEERARALERLFAAVDDFDGVKATEER